MASLSYISVILLSFLVYLCFFGRNHEKQGGVLENMIENMIKSEVKKRAIREGKCVLSFSLNKS